MLTGSASSVDVSTLIGLTRFLTNTMDNVAAYADQSIVDNLNHEYREAQTFLLSQILYDWKENTLNGSGNGLINLVAGTNNYAFPTGILTVDRAEISYTGGTNTWVELNPVKLEEIGTAVSNTSGNVPVRYSKNAPRYWARDGRLYIDPIPDQSVTGGLKVWCTTLITALTIGESTGPVFAAAFHPLLAYGAAKAWLLQKDQYGKAGKMDEEKMKLRNAMVLFYSNRQADQQARISPRARNLR